MCWKRVVLIVSAVVLGLGASSGALAQGEVRVLIYETGLSTSAWFAAGRLGYYRATVQTEGSFIQVMQTMSWDLVVLEMPRDEFTQKETVAQLLEDYMAAGGRMLVNFNHLDEWPRLQEMLGVRVTRDLTFPDNLVPTKPKHPIWYRTTRLNVMGFPWLDAGDELSPLAGGTTFGLFENGAPAMVLGNGGTTITNGFDWDTFEGSIPMAHDQMEYLMECRVDFDQSSGRGVLDIFDFLRYQDLFIHQDARANMDFNPSFDIFDFLVFQNSFVHGCN